MKIEKHIHSKQGNYLVCDESITPMLNTIPLVLASGVIEVGQETTLHGWFTAPIPYLGMMGNMAIFFLGESEPTLIDPIAYYYDATFIIAPDRIGKQYAARTFRGAFLKLDSLNNYYWK